MSLESGPSNLQIGWQAQVPNQDVLALWGLATNGLQAGGGASLDVQLRRCAPRADATRHPIVALQGWTEEAKFAAQVLGRPLVELADIDAVEGLQRDTMLSSVLLVGGFDSISYDALDALVLRRDADVPGPDIGLITGRSRSSLRWSLAKVLMMAMGDGPAVKGELSMFACPRIGSDAIYGSGKVLWWDDLTRTKVAEATLGTYATVTLLSHANGIDGNFNDVVLCPVSAPLASDTGPRPSCLHGDICQRDPTGRLRRVHPDSIRAPIVFYDTCAGVFTRDAIATPDAALGTAFLEGYAGALVTSIRKKMSDPFGAVLFRALLADGVPLGRIANVLNRYQRSEYGELPSFVVLGDPAFALRSPGSAPQGVVRDGNMISGWRSHSLVLEDLPSGSDPIYLDGDTAGTVVAFDLRRRFGRDSESVILARIGGHSAASQELVQSSFTLDVAKARRLSEAAFDASELLEKVCEGLSRVAPSASNRGLAVAAGAANDLARSAHTLYQSFQGCVWTGQMVAALGAALHQLPCAAEALGASICSGWVEARQWLVLHHYYSSWLEQCTPEVRLHAACPVCRQLGLSEKSFGRPGRPRLDRRMWTCIRCGVVADMPALVSRVALDGPSHLSPGGDERFVLDVDFNETEQQLESVVMQPYFGGFGASLIKVDLPGPLAGRAHAQGRVSIPFTVSLADDCPPGLYSLVAVAAHSGMPILCGRYLEVLPAGAKVS